MCFDFKIKYFFTIALLLGLICSCHKPVKEKNIELITNASFKYWDIIQKPTSEYYKNTSKAYFPLYCYYFDINGNFTLLFYDKNSRRTPWGKSKYDDYIVPDKWEYLTDSTINIQKTMYYIRKLTPDSLILECSSKYIGTIILAKSDKQ